MILFLVEFLVVLAGLCVQLLCRNWGMASALFALLLNVLVVRIQQIEIEELKGKP